MIDSQLSLIVMKVLSTWSPVSNDEKIGSRVSENALALEFYSVVHNVFFRLVAQI
jgi:hypothetical protein